ncbi:MAG TPA: DUF4202 family protein [Thermoanaerobaculia bacterium]|jgi:hypothetical protein|nr:DUF4202 family protein [Thermoanaerobaculia bacterium]
MTRKISPLRTIFCAPIKAFDLDDPLSPWGMLAAEFPHVELASGVPRSKVPDLFITAEQWKSRNFNFYELDRRLDALIESHDGPFGLVLVGWGDELVRTAREVLTRCQRATDRRNEASRCPLFDRLLSRHREIHDLAKPLVRADYNHALDTWHWVLRLAPDAGLAVQLAALFHDVERLTSEADVRIERIEHQAADYQAFKDRHAACGAELAETFLGEAGVGAGTRRRAARLIAAHERPAEGGHRDAAAVALLNDADALSFFSLNSVGYLDYYGLEQTRKKVGYTLRRLRPEARRHLCGMRLPGAVAAAVQETLQELEVPQRVA